MSDHLTDRELREIVAIGSNYDPVCAVGHLTECAREVLALRRALRRIRRSPQGDGTLAVFTKAELLGLVLNDRASIDRALARRGARKGSK